MGLAFWSFMYWVDCSWYSRFQVLGGGGAGVSVVPDYMTLVLTLRADESEEAESGSDRGEGAGKDLDAGSRGVYGGAGAVGAEGDKVGWMSVRRRQ